MLLPAPSEPPSPPLGTATQEAEEAVVASHGTVDTVMDDTSQCGGHFLDRAVNKSPPSWRHKKQPFKPAWKRENKPVSPPEYVPPPRH